MLPASIEVFKRSDKRDDRPASSRSSHLKETLATESDNTFNNEVGRCQQSFHNQSKWNFIIKA